MMGAVVADMANEVERFAREIVGIPIPPEPERLSPTRKKWALTAMREELDEYEATESIDEEADALIDLTYFALGRLVEMGIAPRPVFEEVHRANMAKRRGSLSKRPGSLGYDAVKPDGWVPPELKPLLTITLSDAERILERHMAQEVSGRPEPITVVNNVPAKTLRPNPKILVLGYAQHGKDTVCEILRDRYGLRFTSSSLFCAERVVLPAMREADRGLPFDMKKFPYYINAQECFEDRGSHRAFWFDAISEYNREDPTRLGREIFEEYDVYAGVRNKRELHALRNTGAYDLSVWVDRSDHLPSEPRSSCTVEPWMADYVLDNNGSLEELANNVEALMTTFLDAYNHGEFD